MYGFCTDEMDAAIFYCRAGSMHVSSPFPSSANSPSSALTVHVLTTTPSYLSPPGVFCCVIDCCRSGAVNVTHVATVVVAGCRARSSG